VIPQNASLIDSATDMRIKWCKARACVMHWGEEEEEMRCILAFLRWEAGCWDRRQEDAIPASAEHGDGCVAYAKQQADLCRNLVSSFEAHWAETLALVDID
jgi:hypothetical protein